MIDITKYKKFFLPVGFSVLGLVMVVYVAGTLLPKRLIIMSNASGSNKASVVNSVMIGSKIMAMADSEDYCVVNVFTSDNNSKPVKGSKVVINGVDNIDPKQALTNDEGKATFTIKSNKVGNVKISASIDGMELKNSLTLIFK